MLYQFIDLLCDSVNPILLLATALIAARVSLQGGARLALGLLAWLLLGLVITYGLFFLDIWLGLWPAIGGDYSTHTAFALAAAWPLWWWGKWRRALAGLLLVYAALMIIQRYHSVLDILTSASAFLLLALPIVDIARRMGLSGADRAVHAENRSLGG